MYNAKIAIQIKKLCFEQQLGQETLIKDDLHGYYDADGNCAGASGKWSANGDKRIWEDFVITDMLKIRISKFKSIRSNFTHALPDNTQSTKNEVVYFVLNYRVCKYTK